MLFVIVATAKESCELEDLRVVHIVNQPKIAYIKLKKLVRLAAHSRTAAHIREFQLDFLSVRLEHRQQTTNTATIAVPGARNTVKQ